MLYTFIENNKLYVLIPHTGKVYQIYSNYQEPVFVLDRVIQYSADVQELIQRTNAVSLRT